MIVNEIYERVYNKCNEILGSFLLFLAEKTNSAVPSKTVEAIKKNYPSCSASSFTEEYQKWYTNSLILLSALLPERKKEFVDLYEPDKKRKTLDCTTYTISDAISGYLNSHVKPINSVEKVQRQIDIIKSIKDIIDSRIADIRLLIENEVFDNELDSARYLLTKGFNRSAGAICGVLLEKHLKSLLASHSLSIRKKDPTINDLNVELYKNSVITGAQNKYLLYLGDLRNKCDHDKISEPTKDEINDLINGTDRVLKTYN